MYVSLRAMFICFIVLFFSVSGLPMEAGLVGLGRLSRAMSMEDAGRPRRISVFSTTPTTTSPTTVGSPPKFPS